MKLKFHILAIINLVLFILPLELVAQNKSNYLVITSQKACRHGIHEQPNEGPFSVFLFCDDAGGSNIGVILTEKGADPGKIKLFQ
jgi:hypothetical protein